MAENIPYTKEYNANGEITNPIIGSYENKNLSRKKIRGIKKNRRCKYIQIITLKDGSKKTIKHFNWEQ